MNFKRLLQILLLAAVVSATVFSTTVSAQIEGGGGLLGDVNLDGNVNLLDVAAFISVISNGEYQVEADTNQDGTVNLLDVDSFIQLLSGDLPQPQIQNFIVGFLSGANQPDFNIESPSGATILYAGVQSQFQVQSVLEPDQFGPLTVHAVTGGFGPPIEILNQELFFTGDLSQIIPLPPTLPGEVTYMFLSNPDVQDIPLMYLRTEAGPIAFGQALDCVQWQQLALEGLTVPQNALDFQLDPGGDGFVLDPGQPLPGAFQDDPVSGPIGTSDPYVVQLFDQSGLPAAFQPIRLFVDDPTVIGLRPSGFPDELPLQELPILTNSDGFAVFRVAYLGQGNSGVSMVSEIDPFPVPLPLPDLFGKQPVNFQGFGTDPQIPVVRSIQVTKCISNPGQIDEMEVPVNEGLSEDSPVLVFGRKYEIQAQLSGPLPAGTELRWCVEKFGNVVQVVEQDGKICITTPDPFPVFGDKAHVGISVKIVDPNDGLPIPLTESESFDFDLVEKKTITICPIHFGDGVPTANRWATIIAEMNKIYNGTGVCFEVSDIHVGSDDEKKLCACISKLDNDPDKASQRTLTGTLKDCVEADDTLEGDADKITIHVGIEFQLKRDGGSCQGGYNGSATGAVDVACKGGVKLNYDTDDDWANVIVLSPNLLTEARGEQTCAHEVAHILGLPHNHKDANNLLHPTGEGNEPGSKRKLTPTQAADIYKGACALLD